jgi:transposase-like protein
MSAMAEQQAVRLVLDEGKSVTAVARELDLVASALGQWVKQAQADRSKGRTGLTTAVVVSPGKIPHGGVAGSAMAE